MVHKNLKNRLTDDELKLKAELKEYFGLVLDRVSKIVMQKHLEMTAKAVTKQLKAKYPNGFDEIKEKNV